MMDPEFFLPGYLEKTSVLDFVGAASTGVFFSNLGLPDKRILYLRWEMSLGTSR